MNKEKIKADLHNHLGRNGRNPGFDETINLVYSRLGDGGVFGICNDGPADYRFEKFVEQKGGKYNRVKIGQEGRALLVPEKKILIVGVEEVEPKQGHFLVVGMPQNKKIWKTKNPPTLEDALKEADYFRGIKIAVHPFYKEGIGKFLEKDISLLKYFDGWEVYNASSELWVPKITPRNANKKSEEFYNKVIKDNYDIGAVSFTDGHSVEVIGRSYTELPEPDLRNSETLIKSLGTGIRQTKDFKYLHKGSAKLDSAKHVFHMLVTNKIIK